MEAALPIQLQEYMKRYHSPNNTSSLSIIIIFDASCPTVSL